MNPKSIAVITSVYNEASLIPFFLSHYSFADKIFVLFGKSTDNSEALLRADPRVVIIPLDMPEGIDDGKKTAAINAAIVECEGTYAWCIVVDSDELVWPKEWTYFLSTRRFEVPWPVGRYLATVPPRDDYLVACMWQVFRHESDRDLNVKKTPVLLQRRHGDPDRTGPDNRWYCKPVILRMGRGLALGLGNHYLTAPAGARCSALRFDGAHWAQADPSFAVERRIEGRTKRVSAENRKNGWGCGVYGLTEAGILHGLAEHRKDPQVF